MRMTKTVNEEVKLKEKINRLIDKIRELEQTVMEKNLLIQTLQDEIKFLEVKEDCPAAKEEQIANGEEEIYAFIKAFCMMARMIIANDDYIKYSYETKFSSAFYKIEQGVFENYICEYAGMSMKTFLNYCIDLALIKSEENRRCVYNSGNLRIYYVSRPFIDKAIGENQEL